MLYLILLFTPRYRPIRDMESLHSWNRSTSSLKHDTVKLEWPEYFRLDWL